MGILRIYIIFSLLFNLHIPDISAKESVEEIYRDLIQTFDEYIKLENSVFQKLAFNLSDLQLKRGSSLKLTLEEQLGRKWIFKVSNDQKSLFSPSVVVYHLYTLLGLDTPQIHPITLNINGKKTIGNIQEFISNEGTLAGSKKESVKLSELAPDALIYLLKTHVITWLTADYDTAPAHFLKTLIQDNKISGIERIDHDTAFRFLGEDELRWNYSVPTFMNKTYYEQFWWFYIHKTISLDLESNYEFIKFVAYLPDEFFKKLISPVAEGFKDKKNLMDLIIDRKHNLPADFKQFYEELADKRKETLMLSTDIKPKKMVEISNRICQKLRNEIAELKKINKQLQQKPKKQSEIKAVISVNGYRVLWDIYRYYWHYKLQRPNEWKTAWLNGENKSLVEICDQALQHLTDLKSSAANKYEKLAIEYYQREIEKIKSDGKPTYEIYEINKVVENVEVKE